MENNDQYTTSPQQQSQGEFDIRATLALLWRLRYWMALSALCCAAIAFIAVKYTDKIYQRNASILLINESGSPTGMDALEGILGESGSVKSDNEVFVLSSQQLMRRVVDELELNTRYYHFHPLILANIPLLGSLLSIKRVEYYKDAPIHLRLAPKHPEHHWVALEISAMEGGRFRINSLTLDDQEVEMEGVYTLGEPIVIGDIALTLEGVAGQQMEGGERYAISWAESKAAAKRVSQALTVSTVGKNNSSDIITLLIDDNSVQRADDILNTLIEKYNEDAKAFKNATNISTIDFIDKRLAAISRELDNVESSYRAYQESNTLLNVEAQSEMTLTTDMQMEQQYTDLLLQQKILEMIKESMASCSTDNYNILPSNIGITDMSLNQSIEQYNTLVAQRNRLLANSSATNPRVQGLSIEIADAMRGISLTIGNLERVYSISEQELSATLKESKRKLSTIPTQRLDLAQIARKQQIIEPLYLLLQQKREETQIAMYSLNDTARLIEEPNGPAMPTSPKGLTILLIALIVGATLPLLVVYIARLLQTKVQSKEDVERVVSAPILASIPKLEPSSEEYVLFESAGVNVAETFRILRSNLEYLNGQVFQVTSSVAGEGKSFITANLAHALAMVEKRVLVIGLDLRKPTLHKAFGVGRTKRNSGMVDYIVGNNDSLDTLVHTINEHLDVIFAGAVPPNPAELLTSNRLRGAIEYYKELYDYIILDSTPFFLVTDSEVVNRYADATIYVVRANKTDLMLLREVEKARCAGKLKGFNIVLNGIDVAKHGYGYGAGYGYGYGYGESSPKKRGVAQMMQRLKACRQSGRKRR